MKKLVMMAMTVVAALAVKADFLYFQANAFDWTGPKLFDYAMVGVAKDGVQGWGGGGANVYLNIQSTVSSTKSSDAILTDNYDRYHATGWADILSEYMSDEYTFYVETYSFGKNEGDPDVLGWQYSEDTALTYAELKKGNHIYGAGVTDPQNVSPWVVPEPTSGLMLLFGIAGLALKRKRVGV